MFDIQMYRTTLYSVVLSICGYSVIGNDMAKERDRVFYICIYIYILRGEEQESGDGREEV